ncbi:MAG: hypothetical protein KGS61_07410 [Verrucomicrobia bacterium]|nr:hypothetical protein [Verrucomicrobiota bacterium]
MEIIAELVRHLGGPVAEPELRRWLADHFVRFDAALTAVALARRAQMIASVDAQFGKATYDLQAPLADCRLALDSASAVAEDALTPEEEREGFLEARVWFAEKAASAPALPAGGRMVLGRVLLGQRRWRIEASSAARQTKLRQDFEGQLGERVKFVSESRDDLASRFALKESAFDRSLVPPRFLEQPLKIEMASTRVPNSMSGRSAADCEAELRLAADRKFPDCPIPALDGRTPRAAAGAPALRPRLVRLVKARIRDRDEFNLRSGRTDDINWLPRELGLDELVIGPPPLRPRPVQAEDAPEEPVLATFDLPPAPPLPAEPLTLEQASERLRDSLSRFETESEAIESLEGSGSKLLDDVGELTDGLLNDAEFDMLLPFLLQAWFALVPPETRAPELIFGDLAEALHRILQRLDEVVEDQEALKRFLADCRQPALTHLLMSLVLQATSDSGKRITRKGRTLMTLVLVAVVDRLDQALRRGSATAD